MQLLITFCGTINVQEIINFSLNISKYDLSPASLVSVPRQIKMQNTTHMINASIEMFIIFLFWQEQFD